jgi:hypothetical protein
MSAPEAYIEWVNAHLGFNPRSQANSDALADFVVADLAVETFWTTAWPAIIYFPCVDS